MSKTATILAVKASDVDTIPFGATPLTELPLMEIPAAWAGPRPQLETDETFLQIIPYVLVKRGDEYLAYVRTATGGENRLHGKASIGVGGHIDAEDFVWGTDGAIDVEQTARRGAQRELKEELGILSMRHDFQWLGFLRWDATPVDRVHLGLVFLLDLEREGFHEDVNLEFFKAEAEHALGDLRMMSVVDLRSTDLELETWTTLALDLL